MPNYSLVINSLFKPFTYEELVRPYANMTALHRQLEQLYAMMDAQAALWDLKANAETDPIAHALYLKFADDLRAQAELLAMNGLTGSSSYDVYNMLARYAKEIKPIEEAYQRQQQLIASYTQAMLQDPTHFFEYDPSQMSLDKFLQDPRLNTLKNNFSGATLTAMMGEQAQALAKDYYGNPSKWTSILGGAYYETLRHKGLKPEQLFQVLSGNAKAAPEIEQMMNSVLEASGMKKWSNWSEIEPVARAYAMQGAWKAIGDSEYKDLQNPDHAAYLDYYYKKKLLDDAIAAQRQETGMPALNPENYYTVDEVPHDVQQAIKDYNSFEKFFKSDGSLKDPSILQRLTETSTWNEYVPVPGASAVVMRLRGTTSPLAEYIKRITGKTNPTEEEVKTAWNHEKTLVSSGYDATKRTQFRHTLDSSTGDNLKTMILNNNKVLYEAKERADKNGNYVSGDKVDASEVLHSNAQITSIIASPGGMKFSVQSREKDGDDWKTTTKEYIMPIVNGTALRNANQHSLYAGFLLSLAAKSTVNSQGLRVITLSDSDATTLNNMLGAKKFQAGQNIEASSVQEAYRNTLQNLTSSLSNITIVNKTKPQEFEVIGY